MTATAGNAEGEVEKKVRELGDEVFEKYNAGGVAVNDEGKPFIQKEHLKEFIHQIMIDSGEGDAWEDDDFEAGYMQFDKDGSGKIEREEFDAFVKRFADL